MDKKPFPEMILGQRVVLRKHISDMAKEIYWAIHNDRERLGKYLPWVPLIQTIEDEVEYIRNANEAWQRAELFDYGIYKHDGGTFVGSIGVHTISWKHEKCELGYWITGSAEGKGYMSDAVRALERVCFDLGFNRVEIRCDAKNSKSSAVPRRLGYKLEGIHYQDAKLTDGFRDTMVFSKLRPHFENVKPTPFKVATVSEDPFLQRLVEELVKRHGCHTVLLYGSRAVGNENANSDYDIAGIRETGDKVRVSRLEGDKYLDIFIYPESELSQPTEQHLQLRNAKVILEKDDYGQRLLEKIEKIYEAGPSPLPADERQARIVWAKKMLVRIERGDMEAFYRKAWLSLAALEDYFILRGLWYLGSKRSIDWAKENDPEFYSALAALLREEATHQDLTNLVNCVYKF